MYSLSKILKRFGSFGQRQSEPRAGGTSRAKRRTTLTLEVLEDRIVPALVGDLPLQISKPYAIDSINSSSAGEMSAPALNTTTVTSGSWSGYVIQPPNQVSAVGGTWIQPNVFGQGNSQISFWVGIDGYGGNTVEQIGTSWNATDGYQAWVEFFGDATTKAVNSGSSNIGKYYSETKINSIIGYNFFDIRPGNTISASVTYLSSTTTTSTFQFKFQDSPSAGQTKYWQQNLTTQYVVPPRSTGEWIVENPNMASQPLGNFGQVQFSGAWATAGRTTGPIDAFSNTALNMKSYAGMTQDITSVGPSDSINAGPWEPRGFGSSSFSETQPYTRVGSMLFWLQEGNLWRYKPFNGWTELDSSVTSFVGAPNGDIYYLKKDGSLFHLAAGSNAPIRSGSVAPDSPVLMDAAGWALILDRSDGWLFRVPPGANYPLRVGSVAPNSTVLMDAAGWGLILDRSDGSLYRLPPGANYPLRVGSVAKNSVVLVDGAGMGLILDRSDGWLFRLAPGAVYPYKVASVAPDSPVLMDAAGWVFILDRSDGWLSYLAPGANYPVRLDTGVKSIWLDVSGNAIDALMTDSTVKRWTT
jgi:hypothetical protein